MTVFRGEVVCLGGALAMLMAAGCDRGDAAKAPPSEASGKAAPGEAKTEPTAVKAEPAAEPAATPTQAPGVREDGEIVPAVTWFHGNLEQALAKAKAEGKLVFMDVGAYWCPPCHRLDEEVFVRPEVGAALDQRYVALHVDAEKGEGPELVERYHVQAYPTMLVLEASGIEKARLVDFLEPAALLQALARIEQGGNVLTELVDAVEASPDDLSKRYALGHAYLLAADAERAKPELDAVLVGDPSNELGLAAQVLYDRALMETFKLRGEPELAIEEFRALQRRFPDSKEARRAYRDIGRILCTLSREDEAVASLEAMIATAPEDPGLRGSYGWFAFRHRCGVGPGLVAVQRGIELAPDDADLRYVAAELLHLSGRHAEALASIRKASELEPRSAYYRRQVRRFEAEAGAQP